MPGTLLSLRRWSELECNGGSDLGPLLWTDKPEARLEELFQGPWLTRRFTIAILLGSGLAKFEVCRAQIQPPTGAVQTWEFRVNDLTLAETSPSVVVTALGIEFDLQSRAQWITDLTAGVVNLAPSDDTMTPAQALAARVIANAPPYVGLGTVTPTGQIGAVTYPAGSMPWDGAMVVQAAVKDQLRLTYELQLRRNGGTNYLLDMIIVGASASVPDVRSGKNLIELECQESADAMANRILILDGHNGALIGDNVYKNSAVVASTSLDVKDLAGGDGPAQEADQFNTGFVIVDKLGTEHPIVDTVVVDAQTTRFTMASTTNLVVNELVRIMKAGKVRMSHLDRPALQTTPTPGIIARKYTAAALDGASNLLINPIFDDWPGALPVTYSQGGGGTISKDTVLFKFGAQSVKIVGGGGTTTEIYVDVPIYVLEATTWMASFWTQIDAAGNQNRTSVVAKVNGADVAGSPKTLIAPGNGWVRSDLPVPLAAGANTIRVQAGILTTSLNLWVGGMQLLTANGVAALRIGSHPAIAIQLANALASATGRDVYKVTVADLARLNPDRWPLDGLAIGGTAAVRAVALNRTIAPRISRINWNLRNPAETDFDLTNNLPDFVRLLVE